MTTAPVAARIRQALESALDPERLEIIDESARHAHHAGGDPERGETHFHVIVTAAAFAGEPLLRRHRMINDALGDLLAERVHALRITARAPGED